MENFAFCAKNQVITATQKCLLSPGTSFILIGEDR